MQQPKIAEHCPLTPAERGVVIAWTDGNLTDKEAAKALGKGHRTIRTQRENIATRAGAPAYQAGGGHLMTHLIRIGWLRFVLVSGLAITPALELISHTDIPNERARRTRREYLLSAKITQLHTGGAA